MKPLLISMLISMLATALLSDPANIHSAMAGVREGIAMLSQLFRG